MFTGLVEELGIYKGRQGGYEGFTLLIEAGKITGDLKSGDSVAVNGVCLTVTLTGPAGFEAQVMPETLRKTNLASLSAGQPVNLERALSLDGRLGGHLVSGHIDGVGTLSWRRREGNAALLFINTPPALLRYIVAKGSVAVDGVSLTVAAVEDSGFSVSLIPHTASRTTLGRLKTGAAVNLEVDMIGKYVEKLLQPHQATGSSAGAISRSFLQEKGFI